jgi:hypothetical protein
MNLLTQRSFDCPRSEGGPTQECHFVNLNSKLLNVFVVIASNPAQESTNAYICSGLDFRSFSFPAGSVGYVAFRWETRFWLVIFEQGKILLGCEFKCTLSLISMINSAGDCNERLVSDIDFLYGPSLNKLGSNIKSSDTITMYRCLPKLHLPPMHNPGSSIHRKRFLSHPWGP